MCEWRKSGAAWMHFSTITAFRAPTWIRKRLATCIVELYTEKGAVVSEGKNVSMSFRVSARFKSLLEAAAARERRSLTNMLEMLVFAHCEHKGIEPAADTRRSVTSSLELDIK